MTISSIIMVGAEGASELMSEEEIAIRKEQVQRRRFSDAVKSKYRKKPQQSEVMPTDNPELTIKLRQSTVDELKNLSWQLDKKGNDRTYDQIVLHLIRAYSDKTK
jgi:hypothetical protein